MELLKSIKEQYLLQAGLEILHQESRSWLTTIQFWEDETKFYKNFLHNKLFQHINNKDKIQINKILDQVIGIKMQVFKTEVIYHEQKLATLITKNTDSGSFRETHKLLLNDFQDFENEMKQLKLTVFELMKLINQNFFNGNETLNTIKERRSVRKYKSDSIGKFHLEQIISAGCMAPSAMNKQPWKFYVLVNKEKILHYSKAISKVAENVLHMSLKHFHREEDSIFHGAPVVIMITTPKENEWALLDIGMCAQNIMLAARSLGYESCPIGLAKMLDKTQEYPELKIPSSESIQLAIVVGYGDETTEHIIRKTDNLFFIN